jgi:long-chain acyl-CoA synthetase
MNISLNVENLIAELPRRLHEVVDEQAAIAPRHPAVVDHATTLSFEELRQATVHVSARLDQSGVRGGDRVMVVSENCVAAAVLLLALSRLDAWAIIVNPRLSQREVEQIREHSGARLVLFTSSVSAEAATHAAFYDARSALIEGLSEVFVSEINSIAVPERVEDERHAQVAVLIYTSGTTGTPKGVMLTHENLLFSARTNALYEIPGDAHKIYIILPISHIAGFTFLLMSLMMGAAARLVRKFEPARLADEISNGEVSFFGGVPATYQRLLEYKDTVGPKHLGRGILNDGSRRAAGPYPEVARRRDVWNSIVELLRDNGVLPHNFKRPPRATKERSDRRIIGFRRTGPRCQTGRLCRDGRGGRRVTRAWTQRDVGILSCA